MSTILSDCNGRTIIVNPLPLIREIKALFRQFEGFQQQDAAEFLRQSRIFPLSFSLIVVDVSCPGCMMKYGQLTSCWILLVIFFKENSAVKFIVPNVTRYLD
jgi:hypothetical protein